MPNKRLPIIVSIIALLCLVACNPTSTTPRPHTKPAKYEKVGASDISWLLRRDNGIDANFILPDNYYAVVDEKWFDEEVIPGFQSFLFKNGVENYTQLRNDCDDFARAFSFYVRIKFRTMGYIDSTPAVGDFFYQTMDMGHAINVGVFFDATGKKIVRFIEPQALTTKVVIDEETRKYYVKHLGM
jgi:hypothetical protein